MDAEIGKLLKELKKRGLYDNTLIIITADHGECFGEHGLLEHKGSLYQELIRVPLVVKLPAGAPTPTVSGKPVSLVHLFHSILNIANIPHASGRRDADILRGQKAPVIAESHVSVSGVLGQRFGKDLYCLIDGNIKLIISSNSTEELFNIEHDPRERRNLNEERPAEYELSAARVRSSLIETIERLNANTLDPGEVDQEKDKRIREKLKALGYIN
jgi:arylsulfatase A-like enzyme